MTYAFPGCLSKIREEGRESKKQEDKANEARRLELCQEMDTKLNSRHFLTLGTHFKTVTDYRPYCFCLSAKYHES